MEKREIASFRGVGDHPSLHGHRSYQHFFTSQAEAQKMADRACADLGLTGWKIRFTGKHTSRLFGTAWERERLIKLNRSGETVGTLLHEMAHDNLRWGHGPCFKSRQLDLIRWYDKTYPTDPPAKGAPEPEPDVDPDIAEIFRDVREKVQAQTGLNIYLEAGEIVRAHTGYDFLDRAKVLAAAVCLFKGWGLTAELENGKIQLSM